jgi:uncharacterized damage-inducible protein DinB
VAESPEALADLLRQAYFGEPDRNDGIGWHGPSVHRIVEEIGFETASKRQGDGHSIWELLLHIAVWDEVCARRLGGEVIAITTGDPGDWLEVGEPSPAAWRAAKDRLEAAQVRLIDVVTRLKSEALAARTPGCEWTNYTMIHGTLHHDLYHAGQISLLRRQFA